MDKTQPIAIIGLNLKFPGDAVSPESFWEMLQNARHASGQVPSSRFNVEAFYHPDPARMDSMRVKNAHFMKEDPRAFDAAFFNMSPAEASVLDPQQRGLLEGTYHTFENVFCASFGRDSDAIVARDPEFQSRYQATSSGSSMLSNRISHFFDLRGPSLTVDTACSSGLYALHLACQSILAGESEMSVVCGSNTYSTPECMSFPLSNAGFLSPDGRSYSFDRKANGYARGEGYAFVLLKPLDAALRDGDTVRAVIRATGVNQDGRTPSITQPSVEAQVELINRTYQTAGLSLDETDYVEAHGTGTPVGDPIEAAAIGQVFRAHRSRPVWIGSVKSNIGHLEGASGLAGLLKAVLSLERGVRPPIADFEEANPAIDAESLGIRFPKKSIPWPNSPSGIRRASISSFGYGGSNAHAVMDDAYNYLRIRGLQGNHNSASLPGQDDSTPSNALEGTAASPTNDYDSDFDETTTPQALLTFSAADEDGARRQADSLSPVVCTLLSKAPELAFIFTGQGAQYAKTAIGLRQYPVFRQSLEECDECLRSLGCSWSVVAELQEPPASSNINKPAYSQPLCTALQVAIVDLFRTWGVAPQSVCGHSSGEIAAAYCAGAIDRQSAWKIAYFRGVFAGKLASDETLKKTTMMSVVLSQEGVSPYLKDRLSIACINSPVNVTLSGPTEAIDGLLKVLEEDEVFARKLSVEVWYHSKAMEAIADDHGRAIRDICAPAKGLDDNSPVVIYSSTTGNVVSHMEVADPAHWVQNLVSPVLFSAAISTLAAKREAQQFLVEIGPQGALRRPVQDTLKDHYGDGKKPAVKHQYISALKKGEDDEQAVLSTLGALWAAGVPVDLNRLNEDSVQSERKPKLLPDLPSYPFNHSREFWEESRLSRNYASRPYRRHALLGVRDRDWNAEEASWRHIIRSQENPWILDHALNDSPLYPGAGMLVMAIEAARQLATPVSDRIIGYQLENVRFLRAINVDDSERGTEAKIVVRRRRQATNASGQKLCYDWRVFGANGDDWDECAYGGIKVELEPEEGSASAEESARSEARRARFAASVSAELQRDAEKCRLSVHPSQFYKNMSKRSGFDYGPYFQLLRNISYDREGHAAATLSLRDYAGTMPYASENPCVVHPSTLDAICHLQMVALSQGGWNAVPTMMFSHLRKLWVSNKLLGSAGNPELPVATHETMRAFREAECRTTVVLGDEPVIVLDGQRGTAISSLQKSAGGSDSDEHSKQMLYSLEYKPDLAETIDRADAIALHFIEATLDAIDGENTPIKYGDHLERYVAWMRRVRQSRDKWTLESRGLGHLDPQGLLRDADDEPTQRLTKKVGHHLHAILKGEENALQIIFEGNLANACPKSSIPSLRVLEVGAGTGSSTGRILPYLTAEGAVEWGAPKPVRFGEYVYTDVSAGFFEKARERFSYAASHMTFRKLDLEKDPSSQGFPSRTYDVVVAGNVLHATTDLIQTLRHVRSLLRPGGVLVLGETVNLDNARDGLIFGLLPGWWLRKGQWWSADEEYRDQGPLLTEAQWDVVLREAGFPGVQMVFRDHEEEPHQRVSVMVTTRPEDETTIDGYVDVAAEKLPTTFGIVVNPSSTVQGAVAEVLRERIQDELEMQSPEIISVADIRSLAPHQLQNMTLISLLELDNSVLAGASEDDFGAIKKMCLETKYTLWLTHGAIPEASNPSAEIAVGLGRGVCSERGDQGFVTLSLASRSTDVEAAADRIMRVVRRLQDSSCPSTENESEFAQNEEGLTSVPRLVPVPQIEEALSKRSRQPEIKTHTFGPSSPQKKPQIRVSIETPGLLDTLFYAEDPHGADDDLAEGEVEIEVRATSMNVKDVMIALGQIPGRSFGFDGAGVVSRVPPGGNSKLQPGDAVIFCSSRGGGFGTFVRCPELQTEKLPRGMSFLAAAAVPAVWSTAVYALDHVARLGAGETVLIHAAAGGVGQAAVQLAHLRGAKVFATVGSKAKRQLVKDLFHLTDDHIFNSRDETFADDVLHATNRRGVDVALNSLGGELLRRSWECIAPFGRFVDIEKADIIANNTLPMGPFDRNVTFSAVGLVVVHEEAKPLMKRILQDVVRLFEENPQLQEPRPLHVFLPSRLEEAMWYLQGGRNTGKVVVDFASADEVSYRPAPRHHDTFRSDATYVVSGGLGGLGREIVRWMISRGARNLLLLSSRGAEGRPDELKFIKELQETPGVTILAPACDITNRNLLQHTLRLAENHHLLPIRGCIKAAMLLRDDMLSNITPSSFHAALAPKHAGSWNLHSLLPPDLDFFIMLSSFCGVMGNRGQANYAAGNAFEDALARHRTSRGDNYDSVTQSLRGGHAGLTQAQLAALLEMLCDAGHDCATPGGAQLVSMVDEPSELARLTRRGQLDWMQKPIFNNLLRIGETDTGSESVARDTGDEVDYLTLVRAAAPDAAVAGEIVTQGLVQKLSKSLSVPVETIDAGKPAYVVGMDSLIAVEVRYWFMKQLQVEVPVFEILKNQSITELCRQVASRVLTTTGR
ncbi:KR domain-containing protein [Colletotrichum plurivorum]|uniref:KR domain-containing protein n=1 Tax=Colletotrichum plurivorum TaxID=2175906 RepID=A0A8H6KC50_9PEZI|nr:KR domain-containing protein [Colletotrichum plurivorum]